MLCCMGRRGKRASEFLDVENGGLHHCRNMIGRLLYAFVWHPPDERRDGEAWTLSIAILENQGSSRREACVACTDLRDTLPDANENL